MTTSAKKGFRRTWCMLHRPRRGEGRQPKLERIELAEVAATQDFRHGLHVGCGPDAEADEDVVGLRYASPPPPPPPPNPPPPPPETPSFPADLSRRRRSQRLTDLRSATAESVAKFEAEALVRQIGQLLLFEQRKFARASLWPARERSSNLDGAGSHGVLSRIDEFYHDGIASINICDDRRGVLLDSLKRPVELIEILDLDTADAFEKEWSLPYYGF